METPATLNTISTEKRIKGRSLDSISNYSATTQNTNGTLSTSSPRNNIVSQSERQPGETYDVSWVTDAEVTGCMICHEGFTLLRRRHHCRACGNVICSYCSPSRKSVYGLIGLQRVCNECIENGVWVAPKRDGVPEEGQGQESTSSVSTIVDNELSKADLTDIYRKHVIRFYQAYAPRRGNRVEALLEKYCDNLEEMYRALHIKYNVPYERIDVTRFIINPSSTLGIHETIEENPFHKTTEGILLEATEEQIESIELDKSKEEKNKKEKDKKEKDKQEKDKQAKAKKEKDKQEKDKKEKDKKEKDKQEKDKKEKDKQEKDKQEKDKQNNNNDKEQLSEKKLCTEPIKPIQSIQNRRYSQENCCLTM